MASEEPFIADLLSLEPEAKWPLLTESYLLEQLSKGDPEPMLESLVTVDPLRRRYHMDRLSHFRIRTKLFGGETGTKIPSSSEISLDKMGLTSLYFPELLFAATSVNVSQNPDLERIPLWCFQSAVTINVDGTGISRLNGLSRLEKVVEVSARECKLAGLDRLKMEVTPWPASLKKLELQGNPVTSEPGFAEFAKQHPEISY